MGNSHSRERSTSFHTRSHSTDALPQSRLPSQNSANPPQASNQDALRAELPVPLFSILNRERDEATARPEARREAKAEKEAKRLERERTARIAEREKSMNTESVDGGYLVTVGLYDAAEGFNKSLVRRLQIERRLAPFWRGLQDLDESWSNAQLKAAARGEPIPDDLDDEQGPLPPPSSETPAVSPESPSNISSSPSRTTSSTYPFQLFAAATSSNVSSSPSPKPITSSLPFLRKKHRLSISATSGNQSPLDTVPQEISLPPDPHVNGKLLEVFLYKNAVECPICFLYYPPHLNRTRCCEQFICSECFVQLKRKDPHPPDSDSIPESGQADPDQLVSEPVSCPYCKMLDFGVTYDPPPFRRGLIYANRHQLASAMSSSSSISSQGPSLTVSPAPAHGRRRNQSISADSPSVVTIDQIRPDWLQKLNDERARIMRRSAHATAIHQAAYVLNSPAAGDRTTTSRFSLGRRGLLAATIANHHDRMQQLRQGATATSADLPAARSSSRRTVEGLEELMMMEAIRQSMASEDERKRKEAEEERKEAAEEERKKEAEEERKKAEIEAEEKQKQAKREAEETRIRDKEQVRDAANQAKLSRRTSSESSSSAFNHTATQSNASPTASTFPGSKDIASTTQTPASSPSLESALGKAWSNKATLNILSNETAPTASNEDDDELVTFGAIVDRTRVSNAS